ncbi:hypothetical protein GCM10023321_18070 [Pseudonocardia eucalypti]|uniref:Uncharacterized protein n=1 Tax=Pseudonocardia eucalypti TaxID=648755 RepID=A0ABP9PSA7_9PSEU|nr:hypothetical protein [Pseudonocardia eucalypti]
MADADEPDHADGGPDGPGSDRTGPDEPDSDRFGPDQPDRVCAAPDEPDGDRSGLDQPGRVRAEVERRRRLAEVFGDVLPESTSDDVDAGQAAPDRSGDERWYTENRPPHHN